MIVVNKTRGNDIVEFVFELIWKGVGVLTKGMLMKLAINSFDRGFLKHIWADVQSNHSFEFLLSEVLSDQSCSTAKVEYADVSWFLFVLFGQLIDHLGNPFWVWVAHFLVQALVVTCEVVPMCLAIRFFIFREDSV